MLRHSHALAIGLVACAAPVLHAGQAAEEELETVYVLGQGETRQVQAISAEQIDLLPAGTSPLKAIEMLPGVNFQSADPYGTYEWSSRIVVRGFNQSQMGYTLDGVPLGDMTYGNHNGLHISRAIAAELIDGVELSQGAGALSTASSSNLGGALLFRSASPLEESGFRVGATGGADSTRRLFARIDTGSLGSIGTRLLFSAMDHTQEKYRGAGEQELRQYSIKAVQPVGPALLTGFYNHSDRAERDYQDLSYDIIERRGWDWDNWYPDWDAAVAAAQACNDAGQDDPVACDDAYWSAAGLRKDKLGYLGLEAPFGEAVTLDAKIYQHHNEGQGLWGTPYVPTPGGAPLSLRTTEYDIDRKGIIASLAVRFGMHTLQFGGWHEDNDFVQSRRFYGETDVGAPTLDYTRFQRNPMQTQWEYAFNTKTLQLFVQDDIAVGDNWQFTVGFKSLDVQNEATTLVGPDKDGTIEAKKSFLPQIGALFRVNDEQELFASMARNMRAHPSSGTSGPFSQSAEVLAATKDDLKPETSTNFELGWRFTTPGLFASVTGYHVDFRNRQLGIPQGVGILGLSNVLANVGDVKSDGVELALGWKPVAGLTWFSSLSWNDARFDDDYTRETSGGPVLVPVKGKQVPDAPKLMLRSELAYEAGAAFFRIDGNYLSKRYYSYLNDAAADSYALFNASAGYRFGALGVLDELTLQLDATNLTDKKYIATLNSNGFVESDPAGTAQTLLPGAPRQWFLSLKARL